MRVDSKRRDGTGGVNVECRNECSGAQDVDNIVPIQQTECPPSALQAGEVSMVPLVTEGIFLLLVHYPFVTHSVTGPFLNSGKGNKMFCALNSNTSQLCGVLSKTAFRILIIFWLSVQMLHCGACSRIWKREFPFAGVAENSKTVHCLGILLYL